MFRTLLQTVQDVCAVVGVIKPSALVPSLSIDRTAFEMFSLANEMAQRIAGDMRDWTALQKQQDFLGDGVTKSFTMPNDYRRMLKTGNVWLSTTPSVPMRFIADPDEWLNRRMRGYSDSRSEWTLRGNQMLIEPAPPASSTVSFIYLHRNCIILNSGGVGEFFANDLDKYALDDRVLKLGMIWQWKANKGSPYAEDMATFADAVGTVQGSDKPSPTMVGRMPAPANATVAYPWPTPTSADWQWPLKG